MIYTATLTPLHSDLSCDSEALSNHCQDLISRGCSGVALFGTTGEGSSFSVKEKVEVLEALIKRGLDPQRIILGISSCNIEEAVKLAQAALKHSCLATLIVPPFFYKNVTDEGVIAFYKEIIKRVGNQALRIILYHIPKYSGVPFNLNVIQALHNEFPEIIVGLKESDGNVAFAKEILATIPSFKLFGGRESQISELLSFGAAGAISGLANAFPELICQQDVIKIAAILQILQSYPIFPAIKSLVERQKGPQWHTMRPPLVPLSPHQSKMLHHLIDKLSNDHL